MLLSDRWVDAAEAAPLPADERPRLLTLPVGPAGGAVVRVWAEHLEQPLVHAVDFFAAVCRPGLPAGAPRGATQGSPSPSDAVAESPAITGDLLGCSGN